MCENIGHLRLCRLAHQVMAECSKEALQVSCKYHVVKTLVVKKFGKFDKLQQFAKFFANFTISISLPVVSQLPVSQQR